MNKGIHIKIKIKQFFLVNTKFTKKNNRGIYFFTTTLPIY